MIKSLFLLSALVFAVSCTTYPPVQIAGVPTYTENEYLKLFQQKTEEAQKYNGLINTMIVGVTHITPSLAQAILARKAQIYQWDEAKYQAERAEMMASLSRETQFFLTLYTPAHRMSDISRKKDLWNLFLDVDGRRYEGAAVPVPGTVEELEPIYPVLDRFSQPYIVSFPIESQAIDEGFEFLITGPVDSAKVQF